MDLGRRQIRDSMIDSLYLDDGWPRTGPDGSKLSILHGVVVLRATCSTLSAQASGFTLSCEGHDESRGPARADRNRDERNERNERLPSG